MQEYQIVSSSFRDPSGSLFRKNAFLYSQINQSYKINYEYLNDSERIIYITKKE